MRQTSFKAFQVANPSTPLPGNLLDSELNAVKATLTQIIANLALIQRDDGEITSSSIGLEQLDGALIALGFDRPSAWSTATVYEVNSAVFQDNKLYICLIAHTSNVFATDLALEKWVETIDFTTLITDAQAAADDAESFAASAAGSASSAATSAAAAATALADSVLKAGSTMTGPLVLSSSTLAAHAASLANVQNNIKGHATVTGGTVDAIQVTMSPVSTVWTLHERIRWTSAGVNTITNPTISKDAGGTNIVIKKAAGSALATSDLGAAGYECEGDYNGTNVILLNPASVTGYTVSAQTEETAPAVGDFAGLYDLSATAERKMTLANIFKVINGLTEDAGPHVDNDFLATYDASATAAKKIKIRSLFKTLSGLTEDTTPDTAADFALVYDASASDVKKVLLSKMGGPVDVQTFTGSGTWTKPASGSLILVRIWGAGGSGGAGTSGFRICTGGGGGAYREKWILFSTAGATETVTIGAGGAAQTTGNGNAGGNSSFGSHVTAYGGGAGIATTFAGPPFPATLGGFGAGLTSGSTGIEATAGLSTFQNARTRDGGGPGGGQTVNSASALIGGAAVNGGAGGGAANPNPSATAGGVSLAGGNGGAAANSGTATSGSAPGGGGGGNSGGTSGAGAAGRCEVYVFS